MKEIVKLIRPHQWVKNGFILLPLFFSLHMDEWPMLGKTLLVAAGFSLVASCIYVLNDLMDIAEDRNHPVKKERPLAKGTVTKQHAFILMAVLLALGLGIIFLVSANAFYLTLIYLIMNVMYSLRLKHIPILDINIIAIGFVVRLFIGSATGEIFLSTWIIIMTFLLALFIAIAKRRDDVLLANLGNEVRKNIDGYNLEFCNGGMMVMASVTIVAYISWCISPEVTARFRTENLYLTVFFVILGILRYMQLTFVMLRSGSPTKLLMRDIFLQLTLIAWVLSFVVLLYVEK